MPKDLWGITIEVLDNGYLVITKGDGISKAKLYFTIWEDVITYLQEV